MAKLRSISTAFWSDPFIEELSPSEKLLYLYFITNEKTNMLGIYELSLKKICFETGMPKETVSKALEAFERLGKIKYEHNYVILVNFMKHQKYNPNMKKAAIECYMNLPNVLKSKDLDIGSLNASEAFESLSNHLGMVRKIEVEDEYKDEDEKDEENGIDVFTFDEFWNLYPNKVAKAKCEPKFNKLTNAEKLKIKETLNAFISYKPFSTYTHPNPEAYLNQKRWEDVIPSLFNPTQESKEDKLKRENQEKLDYVKRMGF